MQLFFTILSIVIFLLIEIIVGNYGILYPILGLGIFYFSVLNRPYLNIVMAILLGVFVDLFIFNRSGLTILLYLGIVIMAQKWQHLLDKGVLLNGVAGSVIFFVMNVVSYGVMLQFNSSFFDELKSILVLAILSIFTGYISMMAIILFQDFVAKKLKIQGFIRETAVRKYGLHSMKGRMRNG